MGRHAFLFDLDGVLVDTASFHFLAWRSVAQQLGFDIDTAFNETLKGVSRVESLDRILTHGGVTLNDAAKSELALQKNNDYLAMVEQMTAADVLPGILPFLQAAKAAGIPMAVASASKNARLILGKIGISSYFQAVIDGNQVVKSKPDPEVFLKAAAALGVQPQQCVVFEDAQAGIEAAKRANMRVVGIGEESSFPDADAVYRTLVGTDPNTFLQLL